MHPTWWASASAAQQNLPENSFKLRRTGNICRKTGSGSVRPGIAEKAGFPKILTSPGHFRQKLGYFLGQMLARQFFWPKPPASRLGLGSGLAGVFRPGLLNNEAAICGLKLSRLRVSDPRLPADFADFCTQS
jgi:hypothetical protein